MKILVVGGGGREHALVWKLSRSPRVEEIFCAPGNAGISSLATCVDISVDDIPALLGFAEQNNIDLTVVGPEAPLTAGIVDTFKEAGLKIFGPEARAAAIEGSKAVAKEIMYKYGLPTARYAVFTDPAEAIRHIDQIDAPCVVKADGLAAGKGVIIATTREEAVEAINTIMQDKVFGGAGDTVIIEECLVGEEVSILAFTDGETVIPMLPAQDHKRIFDNDQGPNTGGMGAYTPAPVCTPELYEKAVNDILIPTVKAMAAEGRPYKGVLYAGLMVTAEGPKILEFNARFGDPEAQPVLMMLESDLVDIIEAVITGNLKDIDVKWKQGASICVVMASGGYPGSYSKGDIITGLDEVPQGVMVFHAGTALKDGHVVTSGGRVLGVTTTGKDIPDAIARAYAGVEKIKFNGAQFRRDIGQKAILRK